MALGIVKFYKTEKGWGAISSEALPPSADAWVHFSVIEARTTASSSPATWSSSSSRPLSRTASASEPRGSDVCGPVRLRP